ncbi:MAG: hypothetical protein ACRCSY_02570 [Cetobacterium sp.]
MRLSFIGFGKIDEQTKAIYIDKETRQYQVLMTLVRKIKNKETGEIEEVYNGMNWKTIEPEEVGVCQV